MKADYTLELVWLMDALSPKCEKALWVCRNVVLQTPLATESRKKFHRYRMDTSGPLNCGYAKLA